MAQNFTFCLSLILLLGIGSQWFAWRFRFPVIILLLFFGLLVGPVLHVVNPSMLFGSKLNLIVNFGVAIILFEGGLNLKFRDIRQFAGSFLSLLTVGVSVSFVLITALAHYLLGMTWGISTVLGSILIVTGPTVIMPMLRHLRVGYALKSLLKWEGIAVDPLGAVLTVTVFDTVLSMQSHEIWGAVLLGVIKTVVIGSAMGAFGAVVIVLLIRYDIIPDFLQEIVVLGAVFMFILVQSLTHVESALLGVTTMGVVLANQKFIEITAILRFKENLRVLLISFLFIVLAANIGLDMAFIVQWKVWLFLALLIVLVRPASVLISTVSSSLRMNEKIFLGFLAPRGIIAAAISSYIAMNLMATNSVEANKLVQIVFLVIIVTVLFYGAVSVPLAKKLGLMKPHSSGVAIIGINEISLPLAELLKKEGQHVLLVDNNWNNVTKARMRGVTAHHANILSQELNEDIDLTDYESLLLMTSNREVNLQASRALRHLFHGDHIYQLAVETDKIIKDSTSAGHVHTLFGGKITFADLADMIAHGGKFKVVKITNEYSIDSFERQYGNSAEFIASYMPDNKLQFVRYTGKPPANPGSSIIYLQKTPDLA